MNQVKHKAFDFSVRGEVRYQESMRRHTSWHAGGYAQRACVPFDLPNLSRFLRGYSSETGKAAKAASEGWFTAAHFAFPPGEMLASERKVKELLDRRLATQPFGQPDAGSVFRNPIGHHAARLIEACVLKGLTLGGAQVSTKHANFIVNLGTATAANIENLIDKVQLVVKHQQGIAMEREIQIVGERA